MAQRRGIVLIVVLAIITVLGLLAGTFAFRMSAEMAAVKASQDLQQARLATVSGREMMVHILRTERTNVDMWYDNPDAFRRVPVWVDGQEMLSASPWDKDPVPGRKAWRYSIVSYRDTGPAAEDVKMRYGLTDEASKINIANLANPALRAQLLSLLDQVREEIRRDSFLPEMLVDSLIDWQDADETPTSMNGAESTFYNDISRPAGARYRAKNRPVQSVDELLMVRGWDGRVLYGEDANRNGYLDPNEDDGGNEIDMFPPDNGDGKLYRGLLPYLTVYSWDWNTSTDNKAKIPLNMVSTEMLQQPRYQYLAQEMNPQVIEFIVQARQRGYRFRSVGELYGLKVYDNGKSNYTKAWNEYDDLCDMLNEDRKDTGEGEGEGQNDQGDDGSGGGPGEPGGNGPGGDEGNQDNNDNSANPDEGNADADENLGPNDSRNDGSQDNSEDEVNGNNRNGKSGRRQQSARPDNDRGSNGPGGGTGGNGNGGPGRTGGNRQDGSPSAGSRDGRSDRPRSWDQQQRDRSERRRDRGPQAETGGVEDENEEELTGTPDESPATAQDMIAICDRFTVETVPVIPGLINVNTAPAIVLRTIPGLSEEQVTAIVTQRQTIPGDQKTSIGWLVANGALDAETFALVSNMLTTRSIQFGADLIGFADHTGTFKRFETVVEMRGHLAQIVYFRDISSLGVGYPVWDDEKSEGLSYDDR